MKRNSGFSLIEIMIVVAILADIVVVAMPSYIRSRKFAQDTKFMTDLRTAADGFEMYSAEHSAYPPNAASPGVIPTGMQQYLSGVDWSNGTSIGGVWNWDNNRNGSVAAVGVAFSGNGDDVRMADIDARFDNGILTTGGFRKKTEDIYALVIE